MTNAQSAPLADFDPRVRAWFEAAFAEPTPAQALAWPAIARGEHVLLCAPTGSGKTLAAFLWALDRLLCFPAGEATGGVRVLYVSPLKALAHDVERNLRTPLRGIGADPAGPAVCPVSVAIRTGDTPQRERAAMRRKPPDILITTPESLYLILTSQAAAMLAGVQAVIVDEIHALAHSKRGAHLALSLERLDALVGRGRSQTEGETGGQTRGETGGEAGGKTGGEAGGKTVGETEDQTGGETERSLPKGRGQAEKFLSKSGGCARARTRARSGPQRIGLSATQRPLDEIGRFLVGPQREVTILDATAPPMLDLRIEVPVESMADPGASAAAAGAGSDPLRPGGDPLRPGGDPLRPGGDPLRPGGDPLRPGGDPLRPGGDPLRPGGDPLQPGGDPLQPLPGGESTRNSIWPAIYPELLRHVREADGSTIVFVNNRRAAERVALRLNELAGEEIARAHHGSLAREERTRVEELLKSGELPCIVATSSLELGIDMGAVELVLQVESPKSSARGLQRVGRAGHSVGELSRGVFFPKFRGDLLECAVVCRQMRRGEIEPTAVPRNALDVLAQQIVAIAVAAETRGGSAGAERDGGEVERESGGAEHDGGGGGEEHDGGVDVDALYELITRTYTYAELSRELFERVLDMLDGRWAGGLSSAVGERGGAHGSAQSSGSGSRNIPAGRVPVGLKAHVVWDRLAGVVRPRRGARQLAIANAGTIPDRGLYTVVLPDGGRVGELDEEMVYEARPGQVFMLGASSWRIEEIGRDRVIVTPAPGVPGAVPFWKGDTLGRPVQLGREIGAFARWAVAQEPRTLQRECDLDERAAENLLAYLREQQAATRVLPSDRTIVLERFRDEIGDWRLCLLSPYGARVHAAWGLALSARVRDGYGLEADVLWSDDGIVLRLPELDAEQAAALPSAAELVAIEPDELRDAVTAELGSSALFGARFREAAARALLIPRAQPGRRTPLWQQRLKAQNLLEVAREHPDFPLVLETYRECLQDVLDLPGLEGLLRELHSRQIELVEVQTPTASPFASSLLFDYLATYMYEGDAPTAERRAAALSLDRDLLRELLGSEELRELIDPGALQRVVGELQRRSPLRRATSRDELHDVLRELGDLTAAEVAERVLEELDAQALLDGLIRERRAIELRVGGQRRFLAAEDAGLYRDALGAMPPAGLPATFLQDVPDALARLVARYAATHGPFAASELHARYRVDASAALRELERGGALVRGEIAPGGSAVDWCDAEVLRRLRRASLAVLRKEVEPAAQSALASFLPAWQGVDRQRPAGAGPGRLREALVALQGIALPVETWERDVLPRRLGAYSPAWLDELCASGELVWVGAGAARAALYFREDAPLLGPPPLPRGSTTPPSGPAHELIRSRLARAPCFFAELLADAAGDQAGAAGEQAGAAGEQAGAAGEQAGAAGEQAGAAGDLAGAAGDQADAAGNQADAAGDQAGAARPAGAPGVADDAGAAATGLSAEALRAALFELVWAGEVTNDSWAPLRWPIFDRSPARLVAVPAGRPAARAGRPAPGGGRFAARRRSLASARDRDRAHPPGRWSLTAPVFAASQAMPVRERKRAQAELLLERHGVLTREQVLAERVEGGFAGLYRTLCDLETLGICRRGYFVEGLGGAQFALAGAVERLRAEREGRPAALVLAACDPAQPYGAALPWPAPARAGARRPARVPGAYVVLVAGVPVLYLERGLRSLAVLAPYAQDASGKGDTSERGGEEAILAGLKELAGAVRAGHVGRVALERIDGEPAIGSRWEEALCDLGFRVSPRRLELSA